MCDCTDNHYQQLLAAVFWRSGSLFVLVSQALEPLANLPTCNVNEWQSARRQKRDGRDLVSVLCSTEKQHYVVVVWRPAGNLLSMCIAVRHFRFLFL